MIEELSPSFVTVTCALTRLRGERIAARATKKLAVTQAAAAARLGYPTAVHHTATATQTPSCMPGPCARTSRR
ncbi:hypothetical protein ACIBL6_19505 [Streptomyces sp. NPDC050400]|uniref:hypothetical protein n=1 Tax=Streptomyces sp. NPDC050400 TaxID=3365610 RepID=UPI0037A88546